MVPDFARSSLALYFRLSSFLPFFERRATVSIAGRSATISNVLRVRPEQFDTLTVNGCICNSNAFNDDVFARFPSLLNVKTESA